MALGDQKFDSPHPKGDPDNLSVAKPKIMRRGDEIADQIAALQMNQVRGSSNETTLNVQPVPTHDVEQAASQNTRVFPVSNSPVNNERVDTSTDQPENQRQTRIDKAESARNRRQAKRRHVEDVPSNRSLIPAYALFTSTVLLLAGWLIGPRIVEEYNFAATRGKVRAEYENAIELLKDRPLENVSRAFQLVAHKIKPSVVSIHAGRSNNIQRGYGSGVIMSSEGYIITNAHVLEGANGCKVQLHDRSRYNAKLVGIDIVSDLAVLKIEATNLVPAVWGDSDSAAVGSIVWAIGSPYRYEQTVTSGIISGKDRPGDRKRKQSLLQTDAAVNPGNSGGPLVDASGNVIGINTSIFGETFQGISFAVPSSTAKFVYSQLIENGSVVRGYLGAKPEEVRYQMASKGYVPDLNGAVLTEVYKNSPADRAGIRPGDVIRQWNGRTVKQYNSLFQLAERSPPNSTVEVVLIRDGQSLKKNVVVGELQNNTASYFIPRPDPRVR